MTDQAASKDRVDELRDVHAGRTGSQKGQYRLNYRDAGLLFGEIEATRDMLIDAHLELDGLRAALGVDHEPHQSLHERMLDAANHKRVERTAHEPPAGQWWCETCHCIVEPVHVTNDETHDLRAGGCGQHVFVRAAQPPLPAAEPTGNWPSQVFRPLPPEEAQLLRDYGVDDSGDVPVPPSPDDARDAARWRHVVLEICHSFDGQDRTYYLRALGRESFAALIDRRIALTKISDQGEQQ